MKKKVLLTSVVTIILCLCLIAGSTYALFTSGASVNIAVTSATVDVLAYIEEGSLKTWSLGQTEAQATTGDFVNKGRAYFENGQLKIDRMTPGDVVKFNIAVVNQSNVTIKCKIDTKTGLMTDANGQELKDLLPALTVTLNGKEENLLNYSTGWVEIPAGTDITDLVVTMTFPNDDTDNINDNDFKNAAASITFNIVAVQGNGVDANGNLITTP